jgi:hypothetical protein
MTPDIAKFELIERPKVVSDPVFHATPERLVQTIMDTEATGMAVRFTTDYQTAQGIYNRLASRLRNRGKRLIMQSQRPSHTKHRDKFAPYNVVMWVEPRADDTSIQEG